MSLAAATIVVVAVWATVLGYLVGLRRFRRRLARLEDERRAATVERRTHAVIMDGPSEGGKTTFVLRLSYPCMPAKVIAGLAATRHATLHRALPLCFAPESTLHVLQFAEAPGERSHEMNAAMRMASGAKVAVWVWDLSRTDAENAKVMNPARLQLAYLTPDGKGIEHLIVFLNKLDLLPDDEHTRQRVDDTKAFIQALVNGVYGRSEAAPKPVVFCEGSALDGTGMFECYGEILRAIGLASEFTNPEIATGPREAA